MAGERILFVDDEASIRKLLSTYLQRRGYQVTTADDGLDALAIVEELKPHLIITDVNMPRVGGLELTRHLRKNHRTARIPIIMLSAQKEAQDILAGYAEGADEYIPKPVDMAIMAVKVETILKRVSVAAPEAPEAPRGGTILFLHGKGGVGNTSMAVNAAVALASSGTYRVALLDLNLEFGNASMLLDLEPKHFLADLARTSPEEVDEGTFDQFATGHSSGVRLVAACDLPERAELVTIPLVQKALDYLRNQADYVLVDTPASFSEINLSALDGADAVCVVTAPHIAALKATADCLDVLDKLNIPRARVLLLLNRVTPGGLSNDQVAQFLRRKADLFIPYSAFFDDAADKGRPLATEREKAGSLEIRDLAKRVVALVGTRA